MISMKKEVESFIAGQDFTESHQYHAVNIDASGTSDQDIQVELAGAGELCVGVLQENYDVTGNPVDVAVSGVTTAIAGAAITVNTWVKVDSNSRFIPVTSNNDVAAGFALTAAGADGNAFLLKLSQGFYGA